MKKPTNIIMRTLPTQKTQSRVRGLFVTMLLVFVSTVGALQSVAQTYISSVAVAGGNNRWTWFGNNGYATNDVDLNKGAGGWDINLGYRTSDDPTDAITGMFICEDKSSPQVVNGCTYYLAPYNGGDGYNADLNRGTRGRDLFLFVTKDNPVENGVLTGIDVKWYGSANNDDNQVRKYDGGSFYANADLNEKAGGKYIYIVATYDKRPYVILSFDANGGKGNMYNYVFVNNGRLPNNSFTREGYYIESWNTKADGSGTKYALNGEIYGSNTFKGNQTLYAIWKRAVAYNVRTKEYYGNLQSAVNEAAVNDKIRMYRDDNIDITINKCIDIDMNGYQISNLYVQNTSSGDTLHISNGQINGNVKSNSTSSVKYDGNVSLHDVTVKNTLWAEGHQYIINGGVYQKILNNIKGGKVDIYGEKTFVKYVNSDNNGYYSGISLYGGYYSVDPSTMEKVEVAKDHIVVNVTDIPSYAPEPIYLYKVTRSMDIESCVKTTNESGEPTNSFTIDAIANENTQVKMHVKLNSIKKGHNAIFGSAGAQGLEGNDVFGVWVDGSDNSFCFSTGYSMYKSPANMAKAGQEYYITLKNQYILIDSIENAKANQDVYHQDFAVYPFHKNTNKLTFGKIAGATANIADMDIYSVQVYDKEAMLMDIVPSFYNTGVSTGTCVYDKLNGVYCFSNAKEKGFFVGSVPVCKDDNHFGYVQDKAGLRQCAICGKEYVVSAENEPYISFNGTSYFDTEYVPNDKTEIRMHFVNQADNNGCQDFFGIGHAYPQSEFAFLNRTTYLQALYPKPEGTASGAANFVKVSDHGLAANHEYYLTMNMKNLMISRKSPSTGSGQDASENFVDVKFPSASYVPRNNPKLTLLVGGILYANNGNMNDIGASKSNFKLFSYEIYEAGKIVHNFRPDSKFGRWGFTDTVNGKFHAMKGSGATSTSTLNDESYVNNKQKFYYSTGVKTTNKTRYAVRFKINNINTDGGVNANHIFGSYKGGSRQITASVYKDNNNYKFRLSSISGGSSVTYEPSYILEKDEVYTIKIRREGQVYIDFYKGDDKEPAYTHSENTKDSGWNVGEVDGSVDLKIFNDCVQDNNWIGDMTLYKLDIYEGDNLIKRYLPFKSDDPCLWDAMSYSVLAPAKRSLYSYSTDMINISPCAEHTYSEAIGETVDGIEYKCKVCGENFTKTRNYLVFNNSRFDTDIKPTVNTNVRMGFNSSDFTNATDNVILFGQSNTKSYSKDGSYYLELVKTKKCYGWHDDVLGYTLQPKRDEYVSCWKNKALIYDSPAMTTPIVQYSRPDAINNYKGTTTLTFPTFDGATTQKSEYKFFFMDIYEGDQCLRKYVPAKYDSSYGVFDIINQTFVMPLKGTAKGVVSECVEHNYLDIFQENGEWKKRCRVCDTVIDMTREELNGDNFIRTNGASRFESADKKVSAGVIDYKTNTNIGVIPVYDAEGNLIHRYYPSRYSELGTDSSEGKIHMYDAVSGNFEEFQGTGMSAYIPECSYHKFYKIEKDAKGFSHKHCYICNAVSDALNTLTVQSAEDLKTIQPENDSHTIYMDMWNGEKQQQNVDAKYPELNKNISIFEFAVLQEGALKHHFLPGIFNKPGVYDVVEGKFYEIPNATVSIAEGCEHKYKARTLSEGCVKDHCYICDDSTTVNYYMDVQFDGNGATSGKMGTQRIIISDAVKLNEFRKDLGIFLGWSMNGELIADGDTVHVTKAYPEIVTFVAKWADAFTYNGDTLIINDENTEKIDIVDDGEHGFATAKTFKGAFCSYTRSLNAGNVYGTLCLPFAIGKNEHPDFDLYVAKDVTSVVNGKTTINLVKIDAVDAGVPCIYKMKDTSETLTINHYGKEEVAKEAGENSVSDLMLHGTYKTIYIDTQERKDVTYYAIQEDKFYRVTTSLSVRPYRAYITSNVVNNARECYYLNFDDEATGIITADGEIVNMNDAEFYSLSGVKLNGPQKGVNIVKMKNGETRKLRIRN